MSNQEVIYTIIICAVITLLERVLPFIIFRKGKVPKIIEYLGKVIPVAIMATLVIYTMKDMSFSDPHYLYPRLIACFVTIGLHMWRKNALLSIFGGTLVCMLLMQFVF